MMFPVYNACSQWHICLGEPLSPPYVTNFCGKDPYPMASAADLRRFMSNLEKGIPMNYRVIKKFGNNGTKFVIFTAAVNGEEPKKFILKQQSLDVYPKFHFTVVLEEVAARISEELDLPINRVAIIPANLPFVLKPFPEHPATVHTFIEGTATHRLGIRQSTLASLPASMRGLTRKIIENMSNRGNVPEIVAFDTFIGNTDRQDANVIYSAALDCYIGIDHGDIFRSLAKYALATMQKIEQQSIILSPQELAALSQYRNTLQKLVDNMPFEKIERYIEEATVRSGLRELGLYDVAWVQELKKNEKENIEAAPGIIAAIDRILRRAQAQSLRWI